MRDWAEYPPTYRQKEVDEIAAATQAAESKLNSLRHLPEEQFRAKLGGFLQRRGFQYDTIRQVIDESWQTIQDEMNE